MGQLGIYFKENQHNMIWYDPVIQKNGRMIPGKNGEQMTSYNPKNQIVSLLTCARVDQLVVLGMGDLQPLMTESL